MTTQDFERPVFVVTGRLWRMANPSLLTVGDMRYAGGLGDWHAGEIAGDK